ncbi:LacI family transcriptional regulator [Saccharopolyspora erythraea NRRL 2338]|uniref:Transcriptional regulator, LacI family n=2 Tax=Saccharopolyspora erythraea TaxID=1836 RepID=A4FII5_SACEN|nr:LacI family DNA-binding transcriptional regulator [Saccharopolyspora erythraea]EQD87898.1 LacI family transcription regulator [Saccharopolyspora erythraea D]PFG97536.1 LacI family transcriptional regulator [Saccharopolyspora erythraea NRRL 2338]QRK87709.1 LacI family DNA-binding transcriptional regulator [Saccharopolyspora erythraea]CAM03860.1 transcriptional regulator, LacI family [Saccharopolyspora erythraea NRRL 2338]
MPRATTLEQVAARAGVSRQTVSNALNAPGKVRPDTLRRVREVIDELGYRPDTKARGLRTRSSGLIGYCVAERRADSVNTFMDRYLRALTAEVERTGRHVLLFTAAPGAEGLPVYEDLLARSAVDAFVLSDTQVGDPRHEWLAERGVPFASFGRTGSGTGDQPGPWVDVDGADGTAQAVRHLLEQGHSRIGFLGLPEGNRVGDDRAEGWRRACAEAGVEASGDLVVRCADEHRDRGEAAELLLDPGGGPTALVAANDALALGAYAALAARGLRVGTDVAVTGFDDSPTASVLVPGLTSLRQPVERVARRMVELLDEPDAAGGELLSPELVVRGSSDPVHSAGGQL